MTNEKMMTMREFFMAVSENEITDEVIEKAKAEIEKLDKRNSDRSNKKTATQVENEAIMEEILEYLETDKQWHTSADIAIEVKQSTNKVASLIRKLIESGKVEKEEKSVPKKGKVAHYKIVEGE